MKTVMGRLLCAVAVLLLAAQAQAADTHVERDYEIALTKGQYEIELGNYKAAVGFLEKALKLKPANQEAQVSLGIALSRTGDLERARHELQQAADRDPKDGRAQYELALVMEKLGNKDSARTMMARAMEVSSDDDLRAAAQGFLRETGEAGEAQGPSLRLAGGMQFDSNVILEQDNPIAPPPEGKSDWRGVIVVNGIVPFWTTTTRGGEAGYQLYQSLHLKLEDYNVQQHAARLGGYVFLSRDTRADLDYVFLYSFVGAEKYSVTHRIAPRFITSLSQGSLTEVHGAYERKRFFNTPVFTALTEKNGTNAAVGVTHTVNIGQTTGFAIDYTYDRETAEQNYWEYTGHRVAANGLMERGAYSFFAGVSYHDRKYGGGPPGGNETRHDGTQELSVGVSRKAGKAVTFLLSDTFTFNDSNLANYEYKRNILSLLVEMTL